MDPSAQLADWEVRTVTMIKNQKLTDQSFNLLSTYLESIITYNYLPSSIEAETEGFLNGFSPQVISSILETSYKVLSQSMTPKYFQILWKYTAILAKRIAFVGDRFLDGARMILEKKDSPFYAPSNQGNIISEYYLQYPNYFIAQNALYGIIQVLAPNSQISIERIEKLITLVFSIVFSIQPNDLVHLSKVAFEKVFNIFANLDKSQLRDLNETKVNHIFDMILQLTPEENTKSQVVHMFLTMNIKLVRSDFLSKKFSAMHIIRKLMVQRPEQVGSLLEKEQLIPFLLQEMHDELVDDFCVILKVLFHINMGKAEYLTQFWNLSLKQHSSVIDKFFDGMGTLFEAMKFDQMIPFIIQVNQFPDASLKFLQKMAFSLEIENKHILFDSLSTLYFTQPHEDQRGSLLVKTLFVLVPEQNVEYCTKIQENCLDMIAKNEHLEYALPLLQASLSGMTNVPPEKAHTYFDALCQSLNTFENADFLAIMKQIIRKFDKQLDDNDFQKLLDITTPFIETNPKETCAFYKDLMDEAISQVFSPNHMYPLFCRFCTVKSLDEEQFQFIQELFKKLNIAYYRPNSLGLAPPSEDQSNFVGIDQIWNLLFNTSNNIVTECLLDLYCNSNDSRSATKFIQQCASNLKNVGSLNALIQLIQFYEDGSDSDNRNRFLFDFDYITVFFKGIREFAIPFPKDISFVGFRRRISSLLDMNPKNIIFYNDDKLISYKNFKIYSNMTVTINRCENNGSKTILSQSPSKILVEQYSDQLFEILKSNDPTLSKLALNLLNLIPYIPQSFEGEWDDVLPIKYPYYLIYKINSIGNLVKTTNEFYVWLIESEGIQAIVNLAINEAEKLPNELSKLLLLRMSKLLLSKEEAQMIKPLILSPEMAKSLIELALNTKTVARIQESYNLLAEFSDEDIMQCENLSDAIKSAIVHPSDNIRKIIQSIIAKLPIQFQQDILLPLLENVKKNKCDEYFVLLREIAKESTHTELIWTTVQTSLVQNFSLPETGNIIEVLSFIPPAIKFLNGLFIVLNALLPQMNDIPDVDHFFDFMVKDIIFNQYKYYELTREMFDVFIALIKKYPKFSETIQPKLNQIQTINNNAGKPNDIHLSPTAKNRGLVNLGATCYMNSIIQQLFNINEFKSKLLKWTFEQNHWSNEFQYLFLKLAHFPSSFVDPSNYVFKWEAWDGQMVDPHEQMDAVEYLTFLFDRLDEKMHNSSSLFKGIIKHTTYTSTNKTIEHDEQFTTLPLEIKGHRDIEDSFRTFLQPDRLEGNNQYISEDGKTDAIRYSKIIRAPRVLILHLKRFEYNMQTKMREKINSYYTFPLSLDISPVMDPDVCKDDSTEYDLIGVVMHSGGAQGGHYFSHVKRENGQWYTINDKIVRKCDGETLPVESAGGTEEIPIWNDALQKNSLEKVEKSSNAYLLIYRKRTDSSVLDQPQLEEVRASLNQMTPSEDLLTLSTDGLTEKQTQVNEDALQRLITEIKDTILKQVSVNPRFSKLIASLHITDDNINFLYTHLQTIYRNSSTDTNSINEITKQCINVAKTNQAFADHIISQNDAHKEFLICGKTTFVRESYANIVESALKNASSEVFVQFSSLLDDIIKTKAGLLLANWNNFDAFFGVFNLIARPDSDLSSFMKFLTETIPIFEAENHTMNIYFSINLSNVFIILQKFAMIKENKPILVKNIFNTKVLINWAISTRHIKQLKDLITELISGSRENNEAFINCFRQNFKTMPTTSLSTFFVLIYSINDSYTKDRIIEFNKYLNSIEKRQMLRPILDEVILRLNKEIRHQFIDHIKDFLSRNLLTTDYMVRSVVLNFMYKIFPEFPPGAPQKVLNADTTTFHRLYEILIEISEKVLNRVGEIPNMRQDRTINEQFFPVGDYLEMLSWTIRAGGFKEEFSLPKYISFFEKCNRALSQAMLYVGPSNSTILPNNFFYFIPPIYSPDEFFQQVSVSKFLKCFEGVLVTKLIQDIIGFIPISKSKEVVDTSFFIAAIKCGLSATFNIYNYIKKIIDINTANKIAKIVFEQDMLQKNADKVIFNKIVILLLKNFPATCKILDKNEKYKIYTDIFIKKRENGYYHIKVLGFFNIAYSMEFKDEKKMFSSTKKITDLFNKYSKLNISYQNVFNLQKKAKHPSSGFCIFLKSLVILDPSNIDNYVADMRSGPPGFVSTCISHKGAAILVSYLAINTSNPNFGFDLIVREMGSMSPLIDKIDAAYQELFESADFIYPKITDATIKLGLLRIISKIFQTSKKMSILMTMKNFILTEQHDKNIMLEWTNILATRISEQIIVLNVDDLRFSLTLMKEMCEKARIPYPQIKTDDISIGKLFTLLESKPELSPLQEIFNQILSA